MGIVLRGVGLFRNPRISALIHYNDITNYYKNQQVCMNVTYISKIRPKE